MGEPFKFKWQLECPLPFIQLPWFTVAAAMAPYYSTNGIYGAFLYPLLFLEMMLFGVFTGNMAEKNMLPCLHSKYMHK